MNGVVKGIVLTLLVLGLQLEAQEKDASPEEGRLVSPASTDIEATDAQAAERDALEPGVPSAVLAQGVRRRATGGGAVMDEMNLGLTEITGNQELPKVLYIVP